MNVLLWVLQILLALHTLMGAIWKLSNSEQMATSLGAIPHTVWLALIPVEIICAILLVLPAWKKTCACYAKVAALVIALEMLAFCGVHLSSGDPNKGPLVYWFVVALVSLFVAYGRWKLKPIRR